MGIVNVTIQIRGKKLFELERGDADNKLIQDRTRGSTEAQALSRAREAFMKASSKAPSTGKALTKGVAKAIESRSLELAKALQEVEPLQRAIELAEIEHRGNASYAQNHPLLVVSIKMKDQIQWRVVDDHFQDIEGWQVKVVPHESERGNKVEAFGIVQSNWFPCDPNVGYVRSGLPNEDAKNHHYEYKIKFKDLKFDPNIYICD